MYSGGTPAAASAPMTAPGGRADDLLGVGGAPSGLGLERLERAHEPGATDDPARTEHESDPHGPGPYPPRLTRNQGASSAISRGFAHMRALTGPPAARPPSRGRAAASSSGPGPSGLGASRRVRRPSRTIARNRRQQLGLDVARRVGQRAEHELHEPEVGALDVGPQLALGLRARDEVVDHGADPRPGPRDALLAVRGAEHDLLQPAIGDEHGDHALEEVHEPGPRVRVGRRRLGERDELVDPLLEQRLDELLLLGEPPVHRPDADPRAPCDLVHRHGEAALGEGLAPRPPGSAPGCARHRGAGGAPARSARRGWRSWTRTVPENGEARSGFSLDLPTRRRRHCLRFCFFAAKDPYTCPRPRPPTRTPRASTAR